MFQIGIFLSAFLLFSLQPMITKYFLPWFGGGASVWAISLVFFTVFLLIGYIYAHILSSKFTPRIQVIIHASMLFFSVFYLGISWMWWGAPLTPPTLWRTGFNLDPSLHLLVLLFATVGFPYGILSATSPLLQAWLKPRGQKTPFHLYRFSNAGSLGALLAYPFFIEPIFSLQTQARIWVILFVVCVSILIRCGMTTLGFDSRQKTPFIFRHHYKTITTWIMLALVPAALLVSTTTALTQGVASVPLLWIVPLALYLLSFVLAFTQSFFSERVLVLTTIFFAILSFFLIADNGLVRFSFQLYVYLAFLFFTAFLFHSILYKKRPNPEHLTIYYVFVSLGGALGTCLMSLGAPLIFTGLSEFSLSVYVILIVAFFLFFQARQFPLLPSWAFFIVRLCIACIVLTLSIAAFILDSRGAYILRERNFYGALQVKEIRDTVTSLRLLYNGNILHGSQFLNPEQNQVPTSYYSFVSGIGAVLREGLSDELSPPRRVAVVGLGAGTVAAYCRVGDTYRFFEINPAVEYIAREYFSYLSGCGQADVVIGDARISLETEHKNGFEKPYDVIVLDAFTDDAIPVHLLTQEAFQTYLDRLFEDGVLAIHISNKYIDLSPVLAHVARTFALYGVQVKTQDTQDLVSNSSTWVLMSRKPITHFADLEEGFSVEDIDSVDDLVSWTDNYSNLFSVIRS